MSDFHDELDKESRRYPEPDPGTLEQVVRRARRQQRVRKAAAIGVALAISLASSFVLVRAFHRAAPGPATHSATPSSPPTATGGPTPTPGSSPTPAPLVHYTSVGQIDVVSPTFAVAVLQHCVGQGYYSACTDELASTSDFGLTWKTLIHAAPPSLKRLEGLGMEQVFFLDAQHGWVVATNCAAGRGSLMRTIDGGQTWHASKIGTSTCNAGAGLWVDFVDPYNGWLTHLEPTGPGMELFATSDGGATWRRMSIACCIGRGGVGAYPTITLATHLDASHWWVAAELSLFHTMDGGAYWNRIHLSKPVCCHSPFVADQAPPTFFGSSGVFVTQLLNHGKKALGFYTSSDGGATWGAPLVVGPSSPAVPPPGFRNSWPLVSVVSPTVWWIADPSHGSMQITTDAGKTWQTRPAPAVGYAVSFDAIDASRAWLVVTDAHGIGPLYTTSDGGRTWTKVTWKGAA